MRLSALRAISTAFVFSGSVISSSMVRPVYSAEKSRIVSTGISVTSRMPMFWKVSSMVPTPVMKMLKMKKYPVPSRNTAMTK